MATLALSLAGQFVGGAVAGPIGATVGRALGALAGAAIDASLFADKPEPQAVAPGADVRLTGSSEGVPIPRLYGWSRLSGNIIWATELEEIAAEDSGAKGGGGAASEEGGIAASFAIGLCEGEVHRLGRIWADGQVLDTSGVTLRFYPGTETQDADSLIEAKQEMVTEVLDTLPSQGGRVELTPGQADRWLGALNDVRLALGTALDVSEDMPDQPDPEDPRTPHLGVYQWLTYVQDDLVQARMRVG